jgi:hypothetical protein
MKHVLPFAWAGVLVALPLLTSMVAVGCAEGNDVTNDGIGNIPPGKAKPGPGADAGAPTPGGEEPEAPVDATPYKVTGGAATLNGMTSDGYVVYYTADGLFVVNAAPGATPVKVAGGSPLVQIRGRVVFAFTNVDYTANVADMTIWTKAGGVQKMGVTLFADDMFAASDDGSRILLTADITASAASLFVAPVDAADKRTALVGPMGRGSSNTCRPRFGFAGSNVVAAWCADGSQAAWLARYAPPTGSETKWIGTTIAQDVLPTFSSDGSGDRLFFITNAYRGMVFQAEKVIPIDNGVTWATFAEDGGALLYTVSDQLRRTALPTVKPTPLVTVGFAARTAFSPNQAFALYSTTVDYSDLERRDLLLASTSKYNAESDRLVDGAKAQVPRSAFTDDSQYVLYLTDVNNLGGTLNARLIGGGPVQMFPKVDNAVAATKGKVVFSDKRTDPNVYPVTSDLKVINLAKDGAPVVMHDKVFDGRTVQITPNKKQVVYSVPRLAETPEAVAQEGIWIQGIP